VDEITTPIEVSDDAAVASHAAESTPDPPAADERPGGVVDAALAPLDSLADRPLAEHPDVYQSIHRTLQDALAEINDA
jgi:hypothetical protein